MKRVRMFHSNMDRKFAASLNMGENLCGVLYIITHKNGEKELQST